MKDNYCLGWQNIQAIQNPFSLCRCSISIPLRAVADGTFLQHCHLYLSFLNVFMLPFSQERPTDSTGECRRDSNLHACVVQVITSITSHFHWCAVEPSRHNGKGRAGTSRVVLDQLLFLTFKWLLPPLRSFGYLFWWQAGALCFPYNFAVFFERMKTCSLK